MQKEGVEATEQELRRAVKYYSGHAFALVLLASLVRRHQLRLADVLHSSTYTQFWQGDIARELLNPIYKQQLDEVQRQLLRAFSIYREPVGLDAVQIRREVKDSWGEARTLLNIGLLFKKMQSYDVALAAFLLSSNIFEDIHSPYRDKVQRQIDALHEELGEQQCAQLRAHVEPQALSILEQGLLEAARDLSVNY